MGRYRPINGMAATDIREGVINGARYTITLNERPINTTVGIVFVHVFRDGHGLATEQFSGCRRFLAADLLGIWETLLREGQLTGNPIATANALHASSARRSSESYLNRISRISVYV